MVERRAAIYVRVSTGDQTTENQLRRLEEVADSAGWAVVQVYDETASGVARRSAYDAMVRDAHRRRFDVLMAWDVSRLGRSLSQLVGLFETLRSLGIDLFLDQQGVDTTSPAGRALLGMAAVFAEFERSMLVERTKAGIERARARGRRIGRPPAGEDVEVAVRTLRSRGMGMDRIARELGVGKSVAQRICQEHDCQLLDVSAG